MSALTEDRATVYMISDYDHHPVAAAAKIFGLSLVMRDATGFLKPGADTASHTFAGVSDQQADNSAGAAGAIMCKVRKEGDFLFAKSGTITEANIGATVYLVDDQTVALVGTTSNDIACGVLVGIVGTQVKVRIGRHTV